MIASVTVLTYCQICRPVKPWSFPQEAIVGFASPVPIDD